jgi:hypothetical protein
VLFAVVFVYALSGYYLWIKSKLKPNAKPE